MGAMIALLADRLGLDAEVRMRGRPMADVAPDLVNPHEPSEACGDTHCYWHHVDESDVGAYRVCFECKHVYRTAENLRQAWATEIAPDLRDHGPDPDPPPAEEIWGCPYCAHDF
jgi:hypothetical protein